MRLHYLQHVPFEGLANIAIWAGEHGHSITGTRLFASEPLPSLDDFDMLVVLGGPMNVDQHDLYPWLPGEKHFIRQATESEKSILGICLGAQLLARVLGAEVKPNLHKEIGWFPISLTEEGKKSSFFADFPNSFDAFHWHGDRFEIPIGASRLAESHACPNQAFRYGDRILGLQFHLEYSETSIAAMIDHCGEELTTGPYIQCPAEMLDCRDRLQQNQRLLFQVLDILAEYSC